jgi:formylglycine-generating enzyme required for sulfatase activity
MEQQPISVFFSYSREDKPLRDELEKHLSGLKRLGVISSWHDRQIAAGAEWEQEIKNHINTDDIILLLVSPAFVYSNYCYEEELPEAIARHDAGEACVVPILLRPIEGWEDLPFAKLQVYPSGGKPVTDWANPDNAYVDIVKGIRGAVKQLLDKRQQQVQAFETWLTQVDLPLTETDRTQLPQWQRKTGLTDAAIATKIKTAQADRQRQAELAEEQRRKEQAERDRLAEQKQQEQIERDRALVQKQEQERLKAEQEAQRKAERDRIEQERSEASQVQQKPFTIYVTKRKLFGGNDRIPVEMVAIPGGKFWMGSPKGVGHDDERPRHEVAIAPFYMSKYPITQAQYQAVMEKNPSYFKGEKRPVEQVSWLDAIAFCDALSKMSGRKVTLPSEAQWEYACRVGTETPFYFGKTISAEQVNSNQNRSGTTDVGIFPPNQFGLYDMHGNVREWCLDHWHGNYQGAPKDGIAWLTNDENASRLLRGGSWYGDPDICRSAYRDRISPDDRNNCFGFRVACV